MGTENARFTILKELLRGPEAFVSGAHLASILGVSRVSVWKVFEQLREEGFEFEAVRRKGYRITRFPHRVHREWVLNRLGDAGHTDVSLSVHNVVDSTNSEAERWLADRRPTPHFIVAGQQTNGRGRHGRVWVSESDENLYLSALFRPKMVPADLQRWTVWVGIHIARALQRLTEIPIQIKWPNDLWIDGEKVGGMLTEARVDYDEVRDLVFGVGLNINDKPSSSGFSVTSLSHYTGKKLYASEIAAVVIGAVIEAFESLNAPETARQLVALWPAYDALSGQKIVIQRGDAPVNGVVYGIEPTGVLLLEDERGKVHRIHSGEVERVRPA